MSHRFFVTLLILSILVTVYLANTFSYQEIGGSLNSLFNSIVASLNDISSILFPKTPTPTDGGYEPSNPPPITQSCSGSLYLSSTGIDTCTITATFTTSHCDSKPYEIRNGGSKCSGTVSGDSSTSSCNWQVTDGSYSYELYVDNAFKSSDSVTCSKTPSTTCSDGTIRGFCSDTKPKFCDGDGNLVDRCDLCGCVSGTSCNATSGLCYTK